MSIRIKLLLSYIAMIIIPIIFCGITVMLISFALFGDNRIIRSFIDTDHQTTVSNVEDEDDIFSRLKILSSYTPKKLEDTAFLAKTDRELNENQAGLLIRRNEQLIYVSPYLDPYSFEKFLPPFEGKGQIENLDFKIQDVYFYYKQFDYYDANHNAISIIVIEHISPIEELARKYFLLFVITLVFGLIVTNGMMTYYMSRSIIKPLRSLKLATERIQKGDLDFQVIPHRHDEIGELSLSFEEMRSRLKESLEVQVQYERNRKELLSNISHDLRTPIMAIKGYIQGIKEGVARTPEQQNKYLTIIYNKVFDMDQLIHELFLFSKLDLKEEPFHFERVELYQYLEDCIEELQLELQDKGITIGWEDQQKTTIFVTCDREKLRRVIMNVIWNSVKYMDKAAGAIRMHMTESSEYITIVIKDNGKGIEAEALPHIFERLYRADHSRNSQTGGSGIGLSIAHHIISQHGGKIWVTSEKGKGTTLSFTLRKMDQEEGEYSCQKF
ncbi:signal transduction histidine kinase [Paenibacillus shirakamiensis]|uniref:histidine kinase n=1 Tax=Paenibacillus shirakamiensis TaxID=1265935 RepID=A0ABS4JEG0_9BACL|nr:HAMP domain-containing sensor histidine kinase [Paenibacillus shirakamiensis]MBP2000091.1 signal transduction histidine kinase [Paenibacillus shirakamiensis]